MQYIPEDIIQIKSWLIQHKESLNISCINKENGIETWQVKNKSHKIMITEDLTRSDIIKMIEKAIKEISKIIHWSIKETEKEVLLDGIHLIDILPFKDNKYEGFNLQWETHTEYGEYSIFRNINTEVILPWNIDKDLENYKDKRCLRELMTQFINIIGIE